MVFVFDATSYTSPSLCLLVNVIIPRLNVLGGNDILHLALSGMLLLHSATCRFMPRVLQMSSEDKETSLSMARRAARGRPAAIALNTSQCSGNGSRSSRASGPSFNVFDQRIVAPIPADRDSSASLPVAVRIAWWKSRSA